jgi:hypothetical protein
MTSLVRVAPFAAGLVLFISFAPIGAKAQPPPEEEDDFELEVPAEPPANPAEPPAAEPPAEPPPTLTLPAEPTGVDRLGALEEEIARLRGRVEELESEEAAEETTPAQASAGGDVSPTTTSPTTARLAASARSRTFRAPLGVRFSGYLQLQYEHNEFSEDQLQQGGTPLNQDRFSVRRGRLRVRGIWDYVTAEFEVDASTVNGPNVSVRRANLSALWRNPHDWQAPPYVAITAGLTEMPFGIELQLGQDELVFMERSTGSLAFFPGPTDVGAVVSGGIGPLRYELGVMNGTPVDDRSGTLRREPNRAPDFFGRVGVDVLAGDVFELVGGVSFLSGTGFHPGEDATEPTLEWVDNDENGLLDPFSEILSIPGRAATPSENFGRWAVGGDLAAALRTGIGQTRLYAEIILASNHDRGLFVADPVTADADIREVSAYGALVQDITEYALVGARYDFYDPNSDLLDAQRGVVVPRDSSIHTISPIVGARWSGHGRLVVQYDLIRDHLGRTASGGTADVSNNRITVRLQGEF